MKDKKKTQNENYFSPLEMPTIPRPAGQREGWYKIVRS